MKKIIALLLLVCMMLCMVSCGISDDPDKIKENLEAADYEVSVVEGDTLKYAAAGLGLEEDALVAAVTAMNEDGEAIFIYICADKDSAKTVEDKLAESFDEIKEEAAEEDLEVEMGRDGTVVYYGTKAAIKAAK